MKAKQSFGEFIAVVLYLVVVLNVSTVESTTSKDKLYIGCDNGSSTMKCDIKQKQNIICISSSSTKMEMEFKGTYCQESPPATSNKNCSKKTVVSYIMKKCNGKHEKCVPFRRSAEISQHCKGAFHSLQMAYNCVSLQSECSTITVYENKIITKPVPSYSPFMMAQKSDSSTKILPKRTKHVNETDIPSHPKLDRKIPAKATPGPGNEFQSSYKTIAGSASSASPTTTPTPKSRKCTPKKGSKTSYPPTPRIPTTQPNEDGRNSGYILSMNCGLWKIYGIIAASLIVQIA